MASTKIKGIQIDIGGSTDKLGNALAGVEQNAKNLQTELRGVNTLLKFDPSNTELLSQKQQILKEAIDETASKLDVLKNAEAQVQEQFKKGDITVEQYRDFQREIVATEQQLDKLKDELKDFASVAGQQIDLAGQKVQEFGGKIKDASSKISEIGGKLAPVSAAATAGLAAAITTASGLEDATKKYLASTGKTIEETERYQSVLQSIHDNGYGEDYADIADKMRIVSNVLGDLPDEELQSVVEKGLMLEDSFGSDFQETLRGVNNLMYQYGMTSEEAFDLFAKGSQAGLDYTHELGDNVAEYVGNFKQAGYSADEYFQLLENGSNNGAYNLDKVNDAINEIKNRIGDGTIKDSLDMFSEETQNVFHAWENGEAEMKDIIDSIVKDINNCTSEQEALTMAAEAFGTMGEDSNLDFVKSLTTVGDTFKDVTGTAEEATEVMYGGTSAKAQEAMRSIKSAMADLGDALLPIVSKIAEAIADAVKRFTELDDGTKNLILTIGGIAAVVSPLIILFGKLTTGIGAIVTGVGKFISFAGNLVTGLKAMTTAQLANNAAVLANPYVLAAAAIAGLVAGIAIWITRTDEKTKQMEEETEKIEEQTQAVLDEANAYRDSVQAREDSIAKGFEELGYYEDLYDELQGLVDQNGKVQEGYESRAAFITDKLSDAIGTEIELVDGQIQNYGELTDTFDKVMEKKKTMIILDQQEAAYSEALAQKTEVQKQAYEAQAQMIQAQNELTELQKQKEEAFWAWEKNKIQDQIDLKQEQINNYKTQYETHQETLESYLNTIGMYEQNYQLSHEGRYNEMMITEQDYLVKQAETGQLSIENIEKLITDTRVQLQALKSLKEQSNSDIYDADIAAQEAQLESLKNSLNNQKLAVNTGNANITEEWLNGLANQLTTITGKQYEFQKLGDGTVQMFINGFKSRAPVAENDMESFASNLVQKVREKYSDAQDGGEYLIEGVDSGVSNQSKQNSVFSSIRNFANNVLGNMLSVFRINSPSKATEEMGEFLDEGMINGIKNKKQEALKTATMFGNDIVSKLQDATSKEITTPTFKKNLLLEASTNFTNSRYQEQQSNRISDLISILNQYLPILAENSEQQLVLDDDTLVGKISKKVDSELGKISYKKRRGY